MKVTATEVKEGEKLTIEFRCPKCGSAMTISSKLRMGVKRCGHCQALIAYEVED
jgi:transcription elongation factor Elf1